MHNVTHSLSFTLFIFLKISSLISLHSIAQLRQQRGIEAQGGILIARKENIHGM